MKIYSWKSDEDGAIFYSPDRDLNLKFDRTAHEPDAENWNPVNLEKFPEPKNEDSPIYDFVITTTFAPLISEKAATRLASLLEPNGLTLPVHLRGDNLYFYFYCTTVSDCLNIEQTDATKSIFDPEHLTTIRKAVFYEDRVDSAVFMIPQIPFSHKIFVTEEFVHAVNDASLTGFNFVDS